MIEVLNQQKKHKLKKNNFKNLLERLTKHYGLKDPEIVLAFVSDREIKKLNQKFLKKDEATDVLSFPLNEKKADGAFYLGGIIISVPRAFDQSSGASHSLEKELETLTIHGFLHLLGFEHAKGLEEEEKKIRKSMLKQKNEKE